MRGTLVSIEAWNRRTSQRVLLRLGTARNSATLGADGFVWAPALRRAPRMQMELMDDDLTGTVRVGQGEFAIKTTALGYGDHADLDWIGAPVRVYSGDGPVLAKFGREFVGRITGGVPNADNGIAALAFEADRSIVDVPLLTAAYTGGGLAEGDPELRGTFKPAGFGSPINVPPVLVNSVLSIFQVDAYSNLQSIAGVYEDLGSLGPSIGNYASYAALAAAAIPEGQWATCLAEGLFRLGATPTGTITCDPVCGFGLPGTMAVRWLQLHAAVPLPRIRTSDFDALTAAVQAVVGAPPVVDFWTTDPGNVLDLLQRLCASCNAVPLLLLDGSVGVSRIFGGATAITMQRQGGDPPVTAWQSSDPPAPWWRMRMTAARSWYVNSPSDIDYEDDLRDQGDYRAGETYRQGNIVRGSDGARYLFINATPTANVPPPNAAYWELYEDAPDATTIRYTSGASLQDKEPQEAGANQTETRTSLYVNGQGPGATANADQVLNNSNSGTVLRIPRPVNGALAADIPSVTGAIKIRLPQGFTNTMMRFNVEIYDYSGNVSATYTIAGYNYEALVWYNAGAQMVGADAFRRPVRFGRDDAGYACIWIGDPDAVWAYPKIQVTNFQAGYSNFSEAQWATGWALSFDAAAAQNVTAGVAVPHSGEARFGINLLEGPGLAATLNAFKTALGTARFLFEQGALATMGAVPYGNTFLTGLPLAIRPDAFFPSGYMYSSVIYHNAGAKNLNEYFPEDVGSNRTETRTARYFEGQGALSLLSSLSYGSPLLTGFNTLATLDRVKLGSNGGMVDEADSYWLTSGAVVTGQGTALYLYNQSYLATAYPDRLKGNPRFGDAYLNAELIAYTDPAGNTMQGLKPGEAGANVTENRTAQYVSGQGTLATQNNVDYRNQIGFLPTALLPTSLYAGQYIASTAVYYEATNVTVASLRPGEGGANITETRTALFLYQQGVLATRDNVGTAQIAPNAVSNFNSTPFSIPPTDAGEISQTGPIVSLTTVGARVKVDVSVDTNKTGTGTNIGYVALMLYDVNGVFQGYLGRPVKSLNVVDGPPLYYPTYPTLPAGTWQVGVELRNESGKGSNGWRLDNGFVSMEETRR
jgi:hypothetical protein